jgi:hypothetical protein
VLLQNQGVDDAGEIVYFSWRDTNDYHGTEKTITFIGHVLSEEAALWVTVRQP